MKLSNEAAKQPNSLNKKPNVQILQQDYHNDELIESIYEPKQVNTQISG